MCTIHAQSFSDAARLSKEVLQNRPNLLPILVTPLMVTLLVISYRTASEVPAVISDFYSRLFITLLNRHDKSKPGGFNRPRKSPLSDAGMQEMFNTFSFATLQEGETEMRGARALDLARRAARACVFDSGIAETFIEDVTEITSLLIREGDQVRFAHKSIQEFHTALYVAGLPDDDARKFYERVRSRSNRDRFSQVLGFLEELDSDRYHQHVTIPDTDAFIERLNPPGKSKGLFDERAHFLQEVRIINKPTGEAEIALMDNAYVVIRPLIERLKTSTEFGEILKRVGWGVYTANDAIVRMIEPRMRGGNVLANSELERRFLRSVDQWLREVTQRATRIKKSMEFRANTRSQLLNI